MSAVICFTNLSLTLCLLHIETLNHHSETEYCKLSEMKH